MSSSYAVDLLADEGAAASDARNFFRCPEYLRAEGVSHSLIIRDAGRAVLSAPLVVRDIPGGGRDAISPYGFPGGSLQGHALDPSLIDFSDTGLVSIFIRDRVDSPVFSGGTRRNQVMLHDPHLPRSVRKTVRYETRRNERLGYTVEFLHGPSIPDEVLADFRHAYIATMRRAEANERYFFTDWYFRQCLSSERSWLVVARSPQGALAAGTLVVLSDGVLHYFLAGTHDEHRQASPTKNSTIFLLDVADEWELPLNFGGGMREGDSLERFKEGFANARSHLVTHEIVCDGDLYAAYSGGPVQRPSSSFFPAYRV